jgi:hypothetical protein
MTREERAKIAVELRRMADSLIYLRHLANTLEALELPDRDELVLIKQLRDRRAAEATEAATKLVGKRKRKKKKKKKRK